MKYSLLVIITLVFLIVIDTFRYLSMAGTLDLDQSTYISAIMIYISIAIFSFIPLTKKLVAPLVIKILFFSWLFWNIFNLIRGAIIAKDYWDWKFLLLSSVAFTFISLVYYVGINLKITMKLFQFSFKYLFLFGFAFIPLTLIADEELYSRLMVPICFFIVFIPYLKMKWKILVIIVVIVSVILGIGIRSNLIKIALSITLLGIFYLNKSILQVILRYLHIFLFVAPVVLLILGLTGEYNVFKELNKSKGYSTVNAAGVKEDVTNDTRTFLYVEVVSDVVNSGHWLIGKSSSGSYHSLWFDMDRRYGSEVNILNIFLYYGMIGVVIYFLLLFTISYKAINHSNNKLVKMLGLIIASRWFLSFIEEYTQYDLNFFFFWLFMGLVSSEFFRKMDENQMKKYIKVI